MSSTLFLLCVISVGLSVALTISEEDVLFNRPVEQKYPVCGPNEVLDKCANCPGEDTCYDHGQIECAAVILPCYPACVCKKGFIRKTLGRECIPKEECGGPCPDYEYYTDCKECANVTCSSIESPVKCDSKAKCTQGCTCWDGYYRIDGYSQCQHRCSCPKLKDTEECSYWNKVFPS